MPAGLYYSSHFGNENLLTLIFRYMLSDMTDNASGSDPSISAAMIRAARGLADLSQTQLGEAMGVSRRTISKIETEAEGRPDSRRREVLDRIRTFFETEWSLRFVFADSSIEEGVLRMRRMEA